MRRRQSDSGNNYVDIPPHMAMKDYWDEECSIEENLRNPYVQKFEKELRRLKSIAGNHKIYAGEAVLMLSRSMGYTFMTLPYGNMDQAAELFKNYGGDEKYRIIDPAMYAFLKSPTSEKVPEKSYAQTYNW